MKLGKLTVIWGGMFSGKTEELQRRVYRATIADKKVKVYKPMLDDRYSKDRVVSHSDREISALSVKRSEEIPQTLGMETQVVAIDEVQFFDEGVVDVVKTLLSQGVDVIVSGLDIDYMGEPFDATMRLAPIAEECIKLNAICVDCGEDAWVSHRESKEEGKVVVGGEDKYKALCRSCDEKRKQLRNLY